MKLIYIAGPFRALTAWQIIKNIFRAACVALDAWKAGFSVHCPHLNNGIFQGELPESVWLNGDKEVVKRCDALLLVEGWEKSEGAKDEMRLAQELEAVANADERLASLGVGSDSLHHWREPPDRTAAQVVAVGEAAGEYDHVVAGEVPLPVPDKVRLLAQHAGQRVVGVVVAPSAGKYDDGEAKRHFCRLYTTPGAACNAPLPWDI
ncbi:hypothetical protein LCGC14_2741790 [marine sediment metagenome]|uniref:DUF4406 domain-containing protein n=1 Tax=marine sediment metagenome TaxID=412755 RepID=A0A0F8Z477_9ZZZZ